MAFCCCDNSSYWYTCLKYPYKQAICLRSDPPCCQSDPPWEQEVKDYDLPVRNDYTERSVFSNHNWTSGGFYYELYKNNKITPEQLYGIWEIEIKTSGLGDCNRYIYDYPGITYESNHAWRCQYPCGPSGSTGSFDNDICGCYINCSGGDGTTKEQGSTGTWCPNTICRTAVCSTGDTQWGQGSGLTYCCSGNWDINCANAAKQNAACRSASNYTIIPTGISDPIKSPDEISRVFYPATIYKTCEESCEKCKIEKECSPFTWAKGILPRPTLRFIHKEDDFPDIEYDPFGEEKLYNFTGCTIGSYSGTIRETDKCCECFASVILPNGNTSDIVIPSGNCCCNTQLSSQIKFLELHDWYNCTSCGGGGGPSAPLALQSSNSFFEKLSEIQSARESDISFNDILSTASSVLSNLKNKNISSVITGGLAAQLTIDSQYNGTVKDIDIIVDLEITENNIEKIISSFDNSEWHMDTDFLNDIQKYNKTIDFSNDFYQMYQYPLKFIHLISGILVDVFFDKAQFSNPSMKIEKDNYNIDIANVNDIIASRLIGTSIYQRTGELEQIRLELTKKLINTMKDKIDIEFINNILNKYNVDSDIKELFEQEISSPNNKTQNQRIEEFIKNNKRKR